MNCKINKDSRGNEILMQNKNSKTSAFFSSHKIFLVFPFKHRFVQGWENVESNTIKNLLKFHGSGLETKSYFYQASLGNNQGSAFNVLGKHLFERLCRNIERLVGKDLRVWHKSVLSLSDDLHPYLKNMLGTTSPKNNNSFTSVDNLNDEHYCFRLNPLLLQIINSRLPRSTSASDSTKSVSNLYSGLRGNCGLALALSGHAVIRRVSSAKQQSCWHDFVAGDNDNCPHTVTKNGILLLGVTVKEATVYLSRTRYGQLVFELRFNSTNIDREKNLPVKQSALSSDLLAEGVHALGYAAHKSRRIATFWRLDSQSSIPLSGDNIPIPEVAFTNRDLAETLVGSILDEPPRWERVFTYTAAVLDETSSDKNANIRSLAKSLARRQTSDYAVGGSALGVHIIKPFENVCHAVSVEGGSVVVAPNNVNFLDDFVNNSVKKIYMPLALIANREYGVLLRLSQQAAIPIEHGEYEQKTAKRLSQLRDFLYNFRLAHRFSVVSNVSVHNSVFNGWRDSLGTRQMIKDLNEDVLSCIDYLSSARRKQFEKRFGVPAIILASMFSFVTVNNATEIVLKMIKIALLDNGNFVFGPTVYSWCSLIAPYLPMSAGLIFASLVMFISISRRRNDIVT